MKRIISLLTVAMLLLTMAGGSFVFADGEKVINLTDSKGEQVFEANLFARTIEGGIQVDGGIFVVPRNNQWVEYDVVAPKAGVYDVNMYVGSTIDMPVTIKVNNGKAQNAKFTKTGAYGEIVKQLATTVYLNEGTNVIKIESFNSGFYFRHISFTEDDGNVIDPHIFAYTEKTSNPEGNHYSFQYNQYVEYEVAANADGWYTCYILTSLENLSWNFSVISNEGTDYAYTLTGSGRNEAYSAKTAIGKLRLKKGANKVKILNNSGGIYFDGIILEKLVTELNGIATTISSFDFSNAYRSAGVTENGIKVYDKLQPEGSNITFHPDNWGEYTVKAPKAGMYNLYFTFSAATSTTIAYSVNGGLEQKATLTYTDGSPSFVNNIYLEEGNNIIRIKNCGGYYYFKNIILEKASDDVLAPQLKVYAEASNLAHEGSRLSFQPGHWIKYEVGALETGWYDIYAKLNPTANSGSFTFNVNEGTDNAFSLENAGFTKVEGGADTQVLLGRIRLVEGANTLKVTKASGYHVFGGIVIKRNINRITEDETEISSQTFSESYASDGSILQGGIKLEGSYLSFQSGQCAEYTVVAEEGGKYNLSLKMGAPAEMKTKITVNDSEVFDVVSPGTDASYTSIWFKMAEIELKAGVNKIKVANVDTSRLFYTLKLKKIATEVNFSSDEVLDGTLISEVVFGGAYVGESADICMAIYKTNADGNVQLDSVDFKTVTDIEEDTTDMLIIEDIEKEEGYTYTAKVFIWQNMAGSVYPIA